MNRIQTIPFEHAAALGFAALLGMPHAAHAQGGRPGAVAIDNDDIGGVVTGTERTRGRRVGDCRDPRPADPVRPQRRHRRPGRYVLPDLPKAKYKIWVRGYGLVDSAKVDAEPGQHLNLTAVPAPTEAAAAQYYPAIYWYSMLKIPAADQFGGKSDIPPNVRQNEWLTTIKNSGCIGCHQIGQARARAPSRRRSAPSSPAKRPGSAAPSPARPAS